MIVIEPISLDLEPTLNTPPQSCASPFISMISEYVSNVRSGQLSHR